MASIVYEGVGGGGSLFGGMKFFLLQRLPTRDRWKELVKVCSALDVASSQLRFTTGKRRGNRSVREASRYHNRRPRSKRHSTGFYILEIH
jgi:hypothetical protein